MYSNLNYDDSSHDEVDVTSQPQQATGLKPIFENERARRISQTNNGPVPGPGYLSGRRLSIPYSEQRRKSSFGIYSRVVMCAVDSSEYSKDAFNCE